MRPFQRFVLAVILVLWLLPAAEAPAESPNTQILNRAAKLLSDESYWNRADTRECPPNASKLSLYCALRHATEEVMGASSHRTAAMEEVRLVIEEKVGEKYDHRLMGYNNDPATKLADIHAVLKTAAERLDRRLARIVPRTLLARSSTRGEGRDFGNHTMSAVMGNVGLSRETREQFVIALVNSPGPYRYLPCSHTSNQSPVLKFLPG